MKRQADQFSLQNLTRVEITSGLSEGERSRYPPRNQKPLVDGAASRSFPRSSWSARCVRELILFAIAYRFPLFVLPFASELRRAKQLCLRSCGRGYSRLDEQVSRSPTDAETYNLLCRAYFMLEDWDPAIAACEHAGNSIRRTASITFGSAAPTERKQTRPEFFPRLGWQRKSVLRSSARLNWIRTAGKPAPISLSFIRKRRASSAAAKTKRACKPTPLCASNPAHGHWVLARIAEKNKDAAGAEREYRAAIEASQSGARAWLDWRISFVYAHRLDEMEKATHTLESAPVDHPESLMHAAGILLRAGREYPMAVRLTAPLS